MSWRLVLSASSVCLLLPTGASSQGREATDGLLSADQHPVAEGLIDQSADERAIRMVWERVISTFNNHDAEAWANLFDESFETWSGDRKSPAEEEEWMAEYFSQQQSVEYRQLDEIGLSFVTPDVALFKTYGQVTNVVDADGNIQPPQTILEAWVFLKRESEWKALTYFVRFLPASE